MFLRFKIIYLTLLIAISTGIIFFPNYSSAVEYNSCCVCINIDTTGEGSSYNTVPKDTEGKMITDSTLCESKSGFGASCSLGKMPECGEIIVETTKLDSEFEGFKDVVLGVTIPSLQFSAPPSEVDSEGNIYISWIGEYLKAVYNFAVLAISIIGVVMLIIMGIKIITSGGGPAKGEAYKRISQIVIGLFIAWGSYAILFAINPDLTIFRSLKIKFIENQPLPEFIGTVDDDVDLTEMANTALPMAEGENPYSKMRSVCVNGPLTEGSLKAVLPTWVELGQKGGAVYVRGGNTVANGCKATGAQVNWMINHLLSVGIPFPNPDNYTQTSIKALTSDQVKLLNKDKTYQAELLTIYNNKELSYYKGRICGDCGTWIYQLYKCAGFPGKQEPLPQLKTSEKEPYFIGGGKDKTCAQAIEEVKSKKDGLKFGDFFWSPNAGHWFMYTGGVGLPYEMVEMGGGSSGSCASYGPIPIPGYDFTPKTCVRVAKTISDYWVMKKYAKKPGCYIYRIIGVKP